MSEAKPVALFLCVANTARSQIAEVLLRHHAGDRLSAISAGLAPGEAVHPLALRVLEEKGLDVAGLRPKHVREFLGNVRVTTAISVCSKAAEACPTTWPGPVDMQYWPISDPAAVEGSEEERLAAFRAARDAIEARIVDWLDSSWLGQATAAG